MWNSCRIRGLRGDPILNGCVQGDDSRLRRGRIHQEGIRAIQGPISHHAFVLPAMCRRHSQCSVSGLLEVWGGSEQIHSSLDQKFF